MACGSIRRTIEVIENWPRPTSITEVRSFLGLVQFFRRFIARFSEIAVPLTNLTKKKQSIGKCATAPTLEIPLLLHFSNSHSRMPIISLFLCVLSLGSPSLGSPSLGSPSPFPVLSHSTDQVVGLYSLSSPKIME
jgi:hypothetical protein